LTKKVAEKNKIDQPKSVPQEIDVKKAGPMPCSKCGAFARRKRLRNRKVRSLAFKRSSIGTQDAQTLEELLSISPELRTLRAFVDDLHALFQVRRTKRMAWRIWRKMRRNRSYLEIESLRKALDVLNKPNMEKLLQYLDRDTAMT